MAGVGTGMGRATAVLFAQEGAKVAVTARRRAHLEETASRIRSVDGEVLVSDADR